MKDATHVALIAGFLIVDWLRFHDILEPEAPTIADWLIMIVSLVVFYVAAKSLVQSRRRHHANAP